MESAHLRRPINLPGAVELGLIGLLLTLAAAAWAVTDERMRGMDAGPGTDPGAVGFFVTAWIVMMAAMMFPSIAPMVLMQVQIQRAKRERSRRAPRGTTAIFVAGYLVTWTAFGLAAYVLLQAVRALSIDAFRWENAGRYVAGGVITAAALYQLTPLKDACLRKCRSPLMFLLTAWRPGRLGALRLGMEHGAWCVGCCWALMAALFGLGVMSVGWMIFIAALIAVEKMVPWKAAANRSIAVLLLVLGLSVAFVPGRVPGLTLPGSAAAGDAMKRMEGPSMREGRKGSSTERMPPRRR